MDRTALDILFVEDNPDDVELTKSCLAEVESIEAARRQLADRNPDVVLLGRG